MDGWDQRMRSLPPQALLGSLRRKGTGVILASARLTAGNLVTPVTGLQRTPI